jgi:uncharacterized membrane protein YgcG
VLLLAAALALRRLLESGPDHERGGFTARPLDAASGGARALELAATLAAFAPEARSAPPATFRGGGGDFGGGGASGDW